jgi:hypothetical protein
MEKLSNIREFGRYKNIQTGNEYNIKRELISKEELI